MLLQVKRQKDTSKECRCEVRMYGEALTSDEVLKGLKSMKPRRKRREEKRRGEQQVDNVEQQMK